MSATAPLGYGQGRDVVTLSDGRELKGVVTAQRFDRVELKLSSGMSTSLSWESVEAVDFHAPRPYAEGVAYEEMGLAQEAIRAFSEARALESLRRPLKQEVLYRLARLRDELGDREGALRDYGELVSEFPRGRYLGSATRHLVLGLLARGQAADANLALDGVQRTTADSERLSVEVTLLRGLVAQALGRHEEARDLLEPLRESAVLEAPDRARAALAIARALEGDGERDKALKQYQVLVELAEAPPVVYAAAWNGLADAALEEGVGGRDPERLMQALFAYLRGVVQYLPEGSEPRDEHRRSLAGAAQCFEYLAQLSTEPDERLSHRRRAAELRRQLAAADD